MGNVLFSMEEISLGLIIVGNIWETVSTQLNTLYNEGLDVLFRHLNVELKHISISET